MISRLEALLDWLRNGVWTKIRWLLKICRWPVRKSLQKLITCFPRRLGHRRILLVCNALLMADYLSDKWQLCKDDPRLSFRMLLPQCEERAGAIDLIRSKLPVKTISLFWAHMVPWDLIIVNDHCSGGIGELINRNGAPSVRFLHGVPSKRVNGESYAFGSRAYTGQGRIRYTRLFVASHSIKDFAVQLDPDFNHVISVVGNLEEDKVLAQMSQRDRYRQRLGLTNDDIVVLVTSTWGPYCLFEQMGDAILAQAQQLKNQFKFIFSAHTFEYRPKDNGGRVWGDYLRTQQAQGIIVREPVDDWIPYMIACDIILTDHTSVASRGALLGRPMVYIPIPDDVIEKEGVIRALRDISPKIKHDASDLADCLARVRETYPYGKLKLIAEKMNSYPMQANHRIKKEIYNLLRIKGLRSGQDKDFEIESIEV